MKKKFLIILVVLLAVCATLLSACRKNVGAQTISQLNGDTNFDFKFALQYNVNAGGAEYEPFDIEHGFGCEILQSKDGLTRYTIAGYPDVTDKFCLVSVRTEDSKYSVFGFSVGMARADAERRLSDVGYITMEATEQSFGSSLHGIRMKKDGVNIMLWGDQTITAISISLDVTNKDNVVF